MATPYQEVAMMTASMQEALQRRLTVPGMRGPKSIWIFPPDARLRSQKMVIAQRQPDAQGPVRLVKSRLKPVWLLSFRMISDTRIECRNANLQGEAAQFGPTV